MNEQTRREIIDLIARYKIRIMQLSEKAQRDTQWAIMKSQFEYKPMRKQSLGIR